MARSTSSSSAKNTVLSFSPWEYSWEEDEIKSSGYVVDTLEASIWCLLNSSNYAECVLKAVNLGHDTDTVGAIAGSLAGAMYGLKMIPVGWIAELQNRGLLFDICECFSNSAQSRFNN